MASGAGTPSAGLIYGTTVFFGQSVLGQFGAYGLLTDLNDGVQDLIAPRSGMPNIGISFGDTNHPGTFLPPIAIATVTSGSDNFAVADLNGDGLLDIVVSDTSDHYAGVLLQNRP